MDAIIEALERELEECQKELAFRHWMVAGGTAEMEREIGRIQGALMALRGTP